MSLLRRRFTLFTLILSERSSGQTFQQISVSLRRGKCRLGSGPESVYEKVSSDHPVALQMFSQNQNIRPFLLTTSACKNLHPNHAVVLIQINYLGSDFITPGKRAGGRGGSGLSQEKVKKMNQSKSKKFHTYSSYLQWVLRAISIAVKIIDLMYNLHQIGSA